jgi:hypothetical protein
VNLLESFEVGGLNRAVLNARVDFGSRVQHERLRRRRPNRFFAGRPGQGGQDASPEGKKLHRSTTNRSKGRQ